MSEEPRGPYPQVISRAGPIEWAMAAISLIGGLGMALVCATSGQKLEWSLIGGFVGLVGAVWAAALAVGRVTVFEDRVERRSILGPQALSRQDVVSWRTVARSKYRPATLALHSRPPLRFFYVVDPNGQEFRTWLNDLPTTDQTPQQAMLEALAAEPALGPDLETRARRAKLISQVRTALLYACAGLVLLSFMLDTTPEPIAATIGAVPLLAVAAAFVISRLKTETLGGRTQRLDSRWLAPVATVVMITGFAGGKLSLDHGLLDPLWVVLAAVLPGLPLAAAAIWLDRSWMGAAKPGVWVLVLLGAVFSCDALLASANRLLDPDPGRVFLTRINHKYGEGSRYRSYHIVLAAWGGRARPKDETVSYNTYSALTEGERMCVTQHKGALGFGWFTDAPC